MFKRWGDCHSGDWGYRVDGVDGVDRPGDVSNVRAKF